MLIKRKNITIFVVLLFVFPVLVGFYSYKDFEKMDESSIADALRIKLQMKEYKYVEDYLEHLNSIRELTNDGSSKLEKVYDFLSTRNQSSNIDTINSWCNESGHYSSYIVRGKYYIEEAGRIRGTGWSSTVSDEQKNKINEIFQLAQNDLEKAYSLNKTDPNSSSAMITVCRYSNYDEMLMENWFQRAISADKMSYGSYAEKLTYLMPKWHGTPEKFSEFAIHCYENSPEGSRVFTVMLDYLFEVGRQNNDFKTFYENDSVKKVFEDVFHRWLIVFPKSTSARRIKAEVLSRAGFYDQAIILLDDALELNPKYIYAIRDRANLYYLTKKYNESERDYLKALELQPDDHKSSYMLGILNSEIFNKHQAAIYYFNNALSLSEEVSYRRGRANALLQNGEYKKCVEDYSVVISKLKQPRFTDFSTRGICYKNINNNDAALKDFDAALNMSPNDRISLYNRALIFENNGELEKAISDMEHLVLLESKNQNYGDTLKRLKDRVTKKP